MYNHTCANCNKEFETRKETSKYCSRYCVWTNKGWTSEANTECTNCKKMFHLKPFAKKRFKRSLGYFCSNICVGEFKSKGCYDGNKNPNYKGRSEDSDGYTLREYVDCCSRVNGLKRMKLHQAVCCEALGVSKIGKGLHVHHRDCDIKNNARANLAVLRTSDHKWLHKQFGNATLWAHYHNKVKTEELISWSDNKDRARRLIDLNVLNQDVALIGEIKDGELNITDELDKTMRGNNGVNSTELRLK